ncbi:MAG: hypothetical protein U5Q44_04775 [Dehalococcoidia bacterium]|nr:hypothetical protein [Dehalococcoidia bacterium]
MIALFGRQRQLAAGFRLLCGQENRGAQLVGDEGAVGVGELEGRDQQGALADGQVDVVTRVPGFAAILALPGVIRNQAGRFRDAHDAGSAAEAELAGNFGKVVIGLVVESEADLVEDRVAGAHEPLGDG